MIRDRDRGQMLRPFFILYAVLRYVTTSGGGAVLLLLEEALCYVLQCKRADVCDDDGRGWARTLLYIQCVIEYFTGER
jgi:hypothetical protein